MSTKRKGIVSVDFWNTLVDGRVNAEIRNEIRLDALTKLANKYEKQIDAHILKNAYAKATATFEKIWLEEQRTLKTTQIVSVVLQELAIDATPTEIESLSKVYAESIWDGPPCVAEDAQASLERIADQYDLGIISDTMYSPGSVLKRLLDQKNLLHFFKAFVFSDEVGYSKPDIRAFGSIRKQLNASSDEEAFHIGDLQKTDVKGANEAGFMSIQYTGLNPEEPTDLAKKVSASWAEIAEYLLER